MKADLITFEAILRSDLSSFIEKCFNHICPNRELKTNWHIDYIANVLKDASEYKIKRLIINIPPRHLKSISINVAWSAWILGHFPNKRIISVSYSKEISLKHSLDVRSIMNSEWYLSLFPKTKISKNKNTGYKFLTTQYGFRLATSVNATLTGEGADYIIVDDPQNPIHIFSQKYRAKINEWFEQVLVNRIDNRKKGTIVLVMQRLHEFDVVGYLLKKNKNLWTVVSLPIISNYSQYFALNYKKHFTKKGDLLNKKMYDFDDVSMIKEEVGEYNFMSQYMQSPIPMSKSIIKPEWMKNRYESIQFINGLKVISWDTAVAKNDSSSYSVATVWIQNKKYHYLVDLIRIKVDYNKLLETFIYLNHKWDPTFLLLENKSSGQQIAQEAKKLTSRLVLINPKYSKIERVMRVINIFEEGRIIIPKKSSWLNELEEELFLFPNSKKNDQIDSISQYLNWSIEQIDIKSPRISYL